MRISHKQGMATTLATQIIWEVQPDVTPLTDRHTLSLGGVVGVSGQVQAG